MQTIVLVVHIVLAAALVGVVLLQRSEGGGLGLGGGGGGGGFGGLMSGRGTANLLTRSTAVLAGGFIATSLVLAILAGNHGEAPSILDLPERPAGAPAGSTPAVPAQPAQPSAPLAQ